MIERQTREKEEEEGKKGEIPAPSHSTLYPRKNSLCFDEANRDPKKIEWNIKIVRKTHSVKQKFHRNKRRIMQVAFKQQSVNERFSDITYV